MATQLDPVFAAFEAECETIASLIQKFPGDPSQIRELVELSRQKNDAFGRECKQIAATALLHLHGMAQRSRTTNTPVSDKVMRSLVADLANITNTIKQALEEHWIVKV